MIYIFLADGFEEIEAITPVDLLRRASIDIKTVGVCSKQITGAHGIVFNTDLTDSELCITKNDGVILPGGMPGTTNLFNSNIVKESVLKCADNKNLVAAICAAPSVLGRLGLLKDREAVCYPGFENQLYCKKISDKYVVRDSNYITAKGPGVATEFSLEIIKYLKDNATAESVEKSLQKLV